MRPLRGLDLYCCAGLATDGYADHFEMTGVDIEDQPRYPGTFIKADVLELDPAWLAGFDFVHASPLCRRFTTLRYRYATNPYPNQIPATRELLEASGRPYVIENVEGAKAELRDPVMLCGTMFPGLRVIRHRYFEIGGFTLDQPAHSLPHPLCHTLDQRKNHYGFTSEWDDFVQVTGGGNCSRDAAEDAMGVDRYVTKQELNEGLPPAYTRFIGSVLASQFDWSAVA